MTGCFGVGILVVGSIIGYAVAGGKGVIGPIFLGIVLILLEIFPTKSMREEREKEAAKTRATELSQQVWQQAAQSSNPVSCKSCGERVAPLSVACGKCGVTLPGLRISCPKCGANSISVGKKGFSVGQAVAGGVAVGTVGLAAGMIGSGNAQFVCLACNHKWKAVGSRKAPTAYTPARARPVKAIRQPRAKLKDPYTWREDIQKYRCEYCYRAGDYHYCKTLNGIKRHIRDSHTDR